MAECNGRMKVVQANAVSTGAVSTFVPIRPPNTGVEWELIWAVGAQNDGARFNGWTWYDPENPAGVALYGVLGALNVPLPLAARGADLPNISMSPWWATRARYPAYRFEASAAGKTGLIVAIVIEHLGVEGEG